MSNRNYIIIFITLIILTITSLVFYSDFHQHPMYFLKSLNPSCSSTSHRSRIYGDLSAEFEADVVHEGDRFSVLEALKRDGYTPVAVSEVVVDRQPIEYTIACSNASQPTKPFTNATQNVSSVASNKSIDNGSSNDRCNPVDGQLNSTQVLRVPNVVHYVFLGSDLNFTFTNYLSYRSVDRFIRPDQIFVHGDHIPRGMWWNRTIDEVKNIYHVKRTYSNKAPNGQPYKYSAHKSDYMRTETLLSYGGIYMDGDVLVVKSFTPLRQFPFVIGRQTSDGLCNGIMIAERGAPFLRLLLEQYHSYLGPKEWWAGKSVLNADKLAGLYPHLVHVEETTLNRPNHGEIAQIYDGRYNWTQNYAVHLWIRLWPKKKQPNGIEDILKKSTTFAELARLAIFGSHEIRNSTTITTSTQS